MIRLTLALLVCTIVAGCGSPEEQMVDLMNEMADVLEDVKDKDDLEDAVEELEEIAKKGKELSKEVDSKKEEDVPEEIKKEMMAAMGRIQKEIMRISTIPGAAEILSKLDMR